MPYLFQALFYRKIKTEKAGPKTLLVVTAISLLALKLLREKKKVMKKNSVNLEATLPRTRVYNREEVKGRSNWAGLDQGPPAPTCVNEPGESPAGQGRNCEPTSFPTKTTTKNCFAFYFLN